MPPNTMVFEDCTICLDEMHQSDHDHPLQCGRHCGYNFCKNCIESLITSSKDDYTEASDGNRHVKVFLLCPNCRSDLSHTIRDTLLLRKAGTVLSAESNGSTLTTSQEQLKEAMQKPEVKLAIQRALKLEAEYLGNESPKGALEDSFGEISLQHTTSTSTSDSSTEEVEYEEEGVEACLIEGVHLSMRLPKAPAPKLKPIIKAQIDPSLFAGLDYFLSEDERSEVTELMTSGEPSQLAEAAQMLYTVAEISKDPSKRRDEKLKKCLPEFDRRSSVFELIKEAEAAHGSANSAQRSHTTIKGGIVENHTPGRNYRAPSARAQAHRQLDRDLQRQAQFQKHFPIPVRMPKCIELDLHKVFDLDFTDNEWNGTVMDAYSKITISYTGTVTQKRTTNHGVRTALGGGIFEEEHSDVRIALEGQKRVLVSSAGRDSGQQGAVKGDVVTHIAGVEVAGKSAAELFILINTERQMRKDKLIITLNAERSVSEALKRRAVAIAELY